MSTILDGISIITIGIATHVVILAVVTGVAWNWNKFYAYEVSIPHFMLSNIADNVNKHTMTMAVFLAIFS